MRISSPPFIFGSSFEFWHYNLSVNLGKWILRNLFQGFISEEEQAHSRRIRTAAISSTRTTGYFPSAPPQSPPATTIADAGANTGANATGASTVVVVARNMLPAIAAHHTIGLGILQASPSQTQLSPNPAVASTTTVIPVSGGESTSQTPQPAQGSTSGSATQPHQHAQAEALTTTTTATTSVTTQKDDLAPPTRQPSVSSGGAGAAPAPASTTPDESGSGTGFGVNTGTGSSGGTGNGSGASGNGLVTPGTPGGGIIGKLRGFGRASKRVQNENAPGTPAPVARPTGPPATATGQGAGPVSSAVAAVAVATTSTSTVPSSTPVRPILSPFVVSTIYVMFNQKTSQELPAKPRTAAQIVLASGMLSTPTATDAPTLPLAQDIPLFVVEERAPGWAIVYRGTVASAGTTTDATVLEDAIPVWLLEYLLLGRTPQVAIVKVQFALLPGEESLPELVNP